MQTSMGVGKTRGNGKRDEQNWTTQRRTLLDMKRTEAGFFCSRSISVLGWVGFLWLLNGFS